MKSLSQREIDRWITAPRFQAFLQATGFDQEQAMALYDWNVCVSSVFFEVFGYVEVLLRNAIDAQFTPQNHAALVSTTWLYDQSILTQKSHERVLEAEQHLLRKGKTPTRARMVAAMSFGFWKALFDRHYKQLWIDRLHHAFPNGTGQKGEVATLVSRLNPFRNRLAHHEPIIAEPIQDRHDDLLELARLIDTDAAVWIADRSCVPKILEWRPPLTGARRALACVGWSPQIVHFHTRQRLVP